MPQLSRLTARFLAHPRWSALLLGALAACGFQPLSLWPLTLLAMAGLIELIARAPTRKDAALIGWLFGVAHFSLGNNWIATAFTYQANMPAWLGGIAVVLLSLYLAVYPMLAVLGGWWLSRRTGSQGEAALLPGFAACWIISEWLRAWVFTGFAWNPLGMVLLGSFDTPGLAGLARWSGTYGLSGLVVILAGMIRLWPAMAARAEPGRRWQVWAPAIALALVVTLAMEVPRGDLGQARGTVPFTLVQPDIRQEDLNDPRQWEDQFLKTASYTVPEQRGLRRLVLWPESGVPDYLRDGYPAHLYRETTYMADASQARRRIGRVIGPGSLLLTGAIDLELEGRQPVAARNVITAIDENGAIRGSYAKAHLVPYGEYLPMRWLLEPLGASRLVAGTLDFWPGPGPHTIDFGPWGKAGMQICYEIVFSGEVADRAHRPDYLFNPTNDAWFGTWGPPQHLAQARMRAVEEGLPVLRATTTGISAVIDADGVVRQHVPRHVAQRLDGLIPPAAAPTLFARLGNMLPLAWAVFLLTLSVIALQRARR
ncbi:apolipoprotein N-acyltransferase [Novosphingobium sp. JCM 18896]|uniref:apolipoprotein N-acyltransferase n=1 Tax=Novosphingobium sp. JCM 18896 TaxID=2989731 RepID=UPI00222197FA|nr:apolipoprotein N-acyltransferase [Novosphingobium sp. JCM 18896]MCW1431563.1 apolipoprotein N-acyltransferase [Novosphingobium sp. JCM 18896]